jgi:integrase/recombinase XerD
MARPRRSRAELAAHPTAPSPLVPLPSSPASAQHPGSLEALGIQWDAYLLTRNYAATSRVLYRQILAGFLGWSHERGLVLGIHITRPVLEAYQRHLARVHGPTGRPLSPRTQYSRLKVLMMFFRWAVRAGHLGANPAADLEYPRQMAPLPDTLNATEVERLLLQPDLTDPMGLRDRALIEVLWSTGLRRAEVLALTLHDLDPLRQVVRVIAGKGGKDRVVPIGNRALTWVARYRTQVRDLLPVPVDDHRLWLRPDGMPLTLAGLANRVKGYLKAAGLHRKGACHLLRHAMASQLLENGCDVRLIQQILGHARLDTTALYTHVSIRHLAKAHAAYHPAEAGDGPMGPGATPTGLESTGSPGPGTGHAPAP